MPTWDSAQYLRFENERTRPSMDLAARVPLACVRDAVDLGCGPGNSTEVIAKRWPEARLTGVDSSPVMLEVARKVHPDWAWIEADLQQWQPEKMVDLLFSSAAFQWVSGHEIIFPRLMKCLSPGGVLAVQMPAAKAEPALALIPSMAGEDAWKARLEDVKTWHQPYTQEDYYRMLSPLASRIELWETTYIHVMDSHEALLDWVKGTAMRPYLDRLTAPESVEFEKSFLQRLPAHYAPQPDGRILFPFRRLFLVAMR
jgi:trans-aconitate 2-methyltransferase